MSPAELREKGAAIFGGLHGWQAALWRALEVNPRRGRAWLAGDMPIPDTAAAEIGALHAAVIKSAAPLSLDQPSLIARAHPEWVIGSEAPGTDEDAPEWLIRTKRPRLIARILDDDIDGAATGRRVYSDDGWTLDVTWLDGEPDTEAAIAIISDAFAALTG